jgi:hypothetical protein
MERQANRVDRRHKTWPPPGFVRQRAERWTELVGKTQFVQTGNWLSYRAIDNRFRKIRVTGGIGTGDGSV